MAETVLTGYTTMADAAIESGNQGILHMANTLVQQNNIMEDAPYTEANEPNAHKGTQDAFMPTPVFRAYNEGVTPVSPHGRPIIEGLALADAYNEVDWELYLAQGGKKEEWRSRRDAKVGIAMAQKTIIPEVFYGDLGTEPKGFKGLHQRYKSLTTYPNGTSDSGDYNVQSNGGSDTGYMTDIWIVEWDQDECCFTYPQGSTAGIFHEDLGKVTAVTNTLAAPQYHEVARSHFTWKMGMFISDDRRVQRITNINTVAATIAASGYAFDEEKMVDAILRLPSNGANRAAIKIYANTTIVGQMWKRLLSKNNVYFTKSDGLDAGGPVLSFNGYPVRICQAILNTLTTIS